MNTYLIILLFYLGLMFLLGSVLTWVDVSKRSRYRTLGFFVLVLLLWIVIVPFGLMAFPVFIYRWLCNDDDTVVDKYTVTIHALTEENKITLKQIGFDEGHFVSRANIEYDGFRYNNHGRIVVCNNGRIVVWNHLNKRDRVVYNIVTNLPKPEPKPQASE